jgi:hypothetical protein
MQKLVDPFVLKLPNGLELSFLDRKEGLKELCIFFEDKAVTDKFIGANPYAVFLNDTQIAELIEQLFNHSDDVVMWKIYHS